MQLYEGYLLCYKTFINADQFYECHYKQDLSPMGLRFHPAMSNNVDANTLFKFNLHNLLWMPTLQHIQERSQTATSFCSTAAVKYYRETTNHSCLILLSLSVVPSLPPSCRCDLIVMVTLFLAVNNYLAHDITGIKSRLWHHLWTSISSLLLSIIPARLYLFLSLFLLSLLHSCLCSFLIASCFFDQQ